MGCETDPAEQVADAVGQLLTARVAPAPLLVAIDGRSGSGKTVLSRSLVQRLQDRGIACSGVAVEDLYPGWDGLAAALPVLCRDVLAPLAAGRPAVYRTWDWPAGTWGATRTVQPAEVVVVEGVGCLAAPCDPWALRVWVQAPTPVRRERALARDGEVFAPHWDRWAVQETTVLGPPGTAPEADLQVDAVTGEVRASTRGHGRETGAG